MRFVANKRAVGGDLDGGGAEAIESVAPETQAAGRCQAAATRSI